MVEIVVGFLTPAVLGVVGWAIHLGSRVTVIETRREDLVTLINTKFDNIDQRLGRIERALNGHLKDQ